ncbi:class III lanthipeptide [Streptomyces roseifaciens]
MGETTAAGPSLGQLKEPLERAAKAVNEILELQRLAPGAADSTAAAGLGSGVSIGCSTYSIHCHDQ